MSDKQARIILPFFSNLGLWVAGLLNSFLVFFQLREKRRFWGVVYDSVSKQPLDPVKVSLIYVDTGVVESSGITDLEGRYGFLARPGKFKIFAQRSNYIFPSQKIKGDSDGIYSHLYHGEFFELGSGSEVVAPNIPLDPTGTDWNQKAKQSLVFKRVYTRLLLDRLVAIALWTGFIYASVALILTSFQSPNLRLVIYAYLTVFLLELSVPKQRLWGRVIDSQSGRPVAGLEFQLTNPKISGVIFGTARSREDGKYFLRTNPGHYQLSATDMDTGRTLGSVEIRVGGEGVVNRNVIVRGFASL